MPQFFLSYEVHEHETLSQFRDTLSNAEAKVLADVTIGELCAMAEYPNGLYFFFEPASRSLQYVGKCTSRSFIERIPAHFDQREGAWFNTLPKKLAINKKYSTALQEALQFKVMLFGIKRATTATKLESVFRHSYRPALNTPRKLKQFDDLVLSQFAAT